MIEDGKESILRTFSLCKKLYVVENQHIDQLIEMNKVVNGIIAAMIHELINKFLRAHIQNHFIRMQTFYFITDGLCQVRFAKTGSTIDHQWIERIGSWFFSHCFSGPTRNSITVTLNKCIKRIGRVELRIDLHFFQTRNNKRIFNGVVDDQREIHFIIGKRFETLSTYINSHGFGAATTTVHHDTIFQSSFLPQLALQRLG